MWDLRDVLRTWDPRWAEGDAPLPRLEEELNTVYMLTLFHRFGGHVYRVPTQLSKPMPGDALGALQLSEINLPYRCVYLHLGPVKKAELPLDQYETKHGLEEGALGRPDLEYEHLFYYLEGAVVYAGTPPSLEMLLCFRAPRETFQATVNPADDYRFPVLHVTLDFSLCREDALDKTLDNAALVFSSPWDARSESAEINFGKMRALLRRPKEFEFNSEKVEYQLYLQALSRIVPALQALPGLTPTCDKLPLLQCYS